jgi:hypothetical protein
MNKKQQELIKKLQEAIDDEQILDRLNTVLTQTLYELECTLLKRNE